MYRVLAAFFNRGKLYAVCADATRYFLWLNEKKIAEVDTNDPDRVNELLTFITEAAK